MLRVLFLGAGVFDQTPASLPFPFSLVMASTGARWDGGTSGSLRLYNCWSRRSALSHSSNSCVSETQDSTADATSGAPSHGRGVFGRLINGERNGPEERPSCISHPILGVPDTSVQLGILEERALPSSPLRGGGYNRVLRSE
jgi:hypothetical protein